MSIIDTRIQDEIRKAREMGRQRQMADDPMSDYRRELAKSGYVKPNPQPIGEHSGVGMGVNNPRPVPVLVTLEGLAALITSINTAVVAMGFGDEKNAAARDLLALIAKAREVACGKEESSDKRFAAEVHHLLGPLQQGEESPLEVLARIIKGAK